MDADEQLQRWPASVRDNVDALVVNCEQRNSAADPRLVAKLYDEFLQLQQQADSLRQARNENAAAMKVCIHFGDESSARSILRRWYGHIGGGVRRGNWKHQLGNSSSPPAKISRISLPFSRAKWTR